MALGPPEGRHLPFDLREVPTVLPVGLEPTLAGISYLCLCLIGLREHYRAASENRTRDPHLTKMVLYRLSYDSVAVLRAAGVGIEPTRQVLETRPPNPWNMARHEWSLRDSNARLHAASVPFSQLN